MRASMCACVRACVSVCVCMGDGGVCECTSRIMHYETKYKVTGELHQQLVIDEHELKILRNLHFWGFNVPWLAGALSSFSSYIHIFIYIIKTGPLYYIFS